MNCYSGFYWYYFDLHGQNGYDLVCTVHPAPFNSCFDIVIVDIYLYREDHVVFHHFYARPRSELGIAEEPFRLTIGDDNLIEKRETIIRVQLNDGQKCRVDLTLQPLHKSKDTPETELLPNASDHHYFKWKIYAPYCRGKASVRFNGENRQLSGNGYHDFNSGSVNLKRALKSWFWGKYYTPDGLLVYGRIMDRRSAERQVLLTATAAKTLLETDVKATGDKKELTYQSARGGGRFKMNDAVLLDDITFFMAPVNMPGFMVKVMEITAHFCGQIRWLRPLHKLLANARYRRYRAEGTDEKGRPVFSFFEEMIL